MASPAKALGNVTAVLLVLFLYIIGSTLMGGFAGWIVSLLFYSQFMDVFRSFGYQAGDLSLVHFGLVVGFIGGFMKTKTSINFDDLTRLQRATQKLNEEDK